MTERVTLSRPGVARPGRSLWLDALMVGAAGALQSLAYAPAYFGFANLWGLPLAACALLAWRVAAAGGFARGFVLGWSFGTAWLVAGTGWLFISMHRYGGLPAWLSALAVLALSAFLSLYLALAMGWFARQRSGHAVRDALLFGALWLVAEWARGILFTGFPWAASGYAHADGPLAALAPWVGVYGIGAAAAVLAAGTVLAPSVRGGMAGIALMVGVLAGLAWLPRAEFSRPVSTLPVTLLQGNIPQDEKFQPEHLEAAMIWYGRELVKAPPGLVVAPETAIPLLPFQMPEEFWAELRRRFEPEGRHALFGVPLGNDEDGYTNSVAGFASAANGQPGGFYRYDKHHLVPFGEFIPLGFRWFVDMMNMPLGDFSRGPLAPPSFAVGRERIGPNICYEDLFGEELAARLVDGAQGPTIFANVSNIAWFGESPAVEQHLQISRMRTLELQRPMIRATNTGATVVIDHTGRVTHRLPAYTKGVLHASVQGRTGTTPYAWWAGRYGLWPLLGLAVGAVLLLGRRSRQAGAAGAAP